MAFSFAAGDYLSFDALLTGRSGVGFWMRTTQTTSVVSIVSQHASNSRTGWMLKLNDTAGKLRLHSQNSFGVSNMNQLGSHTVNDGAWHYVFISVDPNTNNVHQKVFVDGAGDIDVINTGSFGGNTQPLRFARDLDAAWASYVGDIAEVSLTHNIDPNTPDATAAERIALSRGFITPRAVRRQNIVDHVRLIRDPVPLYGATVLTVSGTTVTDHPAARG